MVNEIIRGNRDDCRNFIAFSRRIGLPDIETLIPEGSEGKILRAVAGGPDLIDLVTAGVRRP